MSRRPGFDDRGQAALIVVVFALFFVMLIGLVSDGGMILSQRRDLQGLADGAARAAATAAGQNASRTSPATTDPVAAEGAASTYLAQAGYTGSVSVVPSGTQVSVELTGTYPLRFARLLGISSTTIHASSTGSPVVGP